ncbi:unnamed protein product [Moneuplotes crassus]|uniref:Uncharacterized protein n=1 Tax=Euplotes crassus TaxID=5936 RepID=A0AAD2D1H7_EUPCR|nr:unnamed protein product [Moneuplotes crassus]
MSERFPVRLICVGTKKSGKTSLIKRYMSCYEDFNSSSKDLKNSSTVNERAYLKNYHLPNGIIIELDIWDTYEDILSLSSLFSRNAKGCFIVCDLSDPDSFSEISSWASTVRSKRPKAHDDFPIYLIGNKSDLLTESELKKMKKQIAKECTKHELTDGFLTSCVEGVNVKEPFKKFVEYLGQTGMLAESRDCMSLKLSKDTRKEMRRRKGKKKCNC